MNQKNYKYRKSKKHLQPVNYLAVIKLKMGFQTQHNHLSNKDRTGNKQAKNKTC